MKPDYAGGSIVNLMASVVAGFGVRSHDEPLGALLPEEIAGHRNVCLFVIDGLGARHLARDAASGGALR